MTLEQNITAILESCFSGFKDELIEACAKRIMEQIERQADTPQTDIHGLTDCDFCSGKPIECEGCGEHICIGCEHQAKKEAWRKAQTDCGWK